MRPLYVIGGSIVVLALAGVLAWTRFAPAQVPPPPTPPGGGEDMVITVPEVEVRSGPSNSFYATSKLRAGEKVKVYPKHEKASPGWLAIEPPFGSRSWINGAYVQKTRDNPNQGIVFTDADRPVPIKPASSVTDKEPDVESAKVGRGTIVVILGKEMFSSNAAWLPIQPPAGDVRFIPESAVAKNAPVQPTAGNGATGFVVPPGGDQSPLAEADAALLRAKQLYQQAAQSSDPGQSRAAQNKLVSLQQIPAIQSGFQQPGYPPAAAQGGPNVALGSGVVPGQTTSGNTALYNSPTITAAAAWTKYGVLKRTTYQKDGQPMYRLEDDKGAPITYAVADVGMTLEPYVGRFVTLYGPTAYRSDDAALRVNYTIAKQLAFGN